MKNPPRWTLAVLALLFLTMLSPIGTASSVACEGGRTALGTTYQHVCLDRTTNSTAWYGNTTTDTLASAGVGVAPLGVGLVGVSVDAEQFNVSNGPTYANGTWIHADAWSPIVAYMGGPSGFDVGFHQVTRSSDGTATTRWTQVAAGPVAWSQTSSGGDCGQSLWVQHFGTVPVVSGRRCVVEVPAAPWLQLG